MKQKIFTSFILKEIKEVKEKFVHFKKVKKTQCQYLRE